MSNWDDLTNPELSKTSGGKAVDFQDDKGDKPEVDRISSNIEFDSAKAKQSSGQPFTDAGPRLTNSAKKRLKNQSSSFIAGGCVPEDDGEMTCKFNIEDPQTFRIEDELTKEYFSVKVDGIEQEINNVEQSGSRKSMIEENSNRILVIDDDDNQVFCEPSKDSSQIMCSEVEPKTTLSYKKRLGDSTYQTQKEQAVEDKAHRQVTSGAVKFPEGGKVNVIPDREMVIVKTEKAGFRV